ncbi:MAG TPA: hypothetical protein VIN10_07510 [Bacteroidales bacterium]
MNKTKNLLAALCFFSINTLSAQYTSGFQQEYFYGNLPSAKVEAMGMADAAIGGSVASLFFNSAGLGGIEDQEIMLSTSAPFYILKNSNYFFSGYARRVIPRIVAAVSVNNFFIGETTFDVNIGDDRYPVTKGNSSNLALSVAGTPVKGLYLGLNFNFFRWRLFEDVSGSMVFNMDFGALYKLELKDIKKFNQHLQFGASVNNFTASKISWEAPDGNQATNKLPIIGRFAAAYFLGTDINIPKAGEGSLDFTFTTEYQNTFNSDYYSTFSLGLETVLYKVLAVRLGYFTQSHDNLGNEVNKSRIADFTYGFGAIVPLNSLTNEKVPLSLHFDYLSLKPPSVRNDDYTKASVGRVPNMRTFTLRVVWVINENSKL